MSPTHLYWTLLVTMLAIFSYEMSLVFYNSFINDLSDSSDSGSVSGRGYALGYIGGGLCLGLNMLMLMRPQIFGLPAEGHLKFRVAFALVGVWWLLFSLPAFYQLRGIEKRKAPLLGNHPMLHAWRQLKETLRQLPHLPDLGLFLLAYVFYNDGIQTILLMASIFGAQELQMSPAQLGLCYLLIQFVAFGGASYFGKLADKWGHKQVILVTLAVYIGVTLWAVFMRSSNEFWALGVVIGIILGGSQAASRSLYSLMIPPTRSAEFFALFSVVGKASAMMGPLLFGLVNEFFSLRAAVGSLVILFGVGGLILIKVDPKRGQFR